MTEPTDEMQDTGLPLVEDEPDEGQTEEQSEELTEEAVAEKQQTAQEAASRLAMNLPDAEHGGAPPWVQLPPGFRFPRGKQILFLRFRSAWTDTPWKGAAHINPETGETDKDENGKEILYRQCVVWPINNADKKLALGRAQRDPNRAADELAKQMIRVHDGVEADWAVVRANGVEMFWNEMGEKCRGLLTRIFTQLHVLDTNSTADFLENCIAVRST